MKRENELKVKNVFPSLLLLLTLRLTFAFPKPKT